MFKGIKMTTTIETYLNSLSYNTLTINICSKGIKSLPDLTRFKNLKKLNCSANQITSLPSLPQTLKILYCSDNKLTSLPTLPQNLQTLYCYSNQLTSLPTLPQHLEFLDCSYNKLTSLPTLPQNLKTLYFYSNPADEIVDNNYCLIKIKQNIQILNNFRHLYYSLKFKKQFRKWLWEKVREPIAKRMYSPNYLVENLDDNEDNLDTVLDNWK
jgi:Leucine-rich repeat (LRR) protein